MASGRIPAAGYRSLANHIVLKQVEAYKRECAYRFKKGNFSFFDSETAQWLNGQWCALLCGDIDTHHLAQEIHDHEKKKFINKHPDCLAHLN